MVSPNPRPRRNMAQSAHHLGVWVAIVLTDGRVFDIWSNNFLNFIVT